MQPCGKHFEVESSQWSGAESTLHQTLFENAIKYQNKTSIVFGDSRYTYANLVQEVENFAAGCLCLGLRKGDKFIACLPNWPEYVVAFFAASYAGLTFIPANPRLRQHEIEFIVQSSGARAAIVANDDGPVSYSAMFRECQKEHPALEHIITVFKGEGEWDGGGLPYEEVVRLGQEHPIAEATRVAPSGLAAIIYTSGTTGVPKGAMLSHRNLLFSGDAMNEAMENTSTDVVLIVVPVCHVFGLAACLMTVATGATMVLMERFQAEEVFKVVEREKVTVHHGVSTMFILELNHPRRKQYDLSSLRTGIVAAAPCPYEVVVQIRSELGLNPILSYGMTETSPALTASHFENEPWVYSTVGQALRGVTLAVVNEFGNHLDIDTVGELICKTPGMMKGYFQNEEATRIAIDSEGWFHTGDLATINESGYVSIVGRSKEMINRGGFKIYPREVEERVYQHSAVQEVAVVGLPDAVLGERSCACVTLRAGHTLTASELRDYCKQSLADYKVPDVVEILQALPLNSSGKIYKLELAKRMREKHPTAYL